MRIRAMNAVNFFSLTGTQRFLLVQTPSPLQQTLPAQDFVDSRDATGEIVRNVKDRGVRVGQFNIAT
jgi:hypothetical protein